MHMLCLIMYKVRSENGYGYNTREEVQNISYKDVKEDKNTLE